MDKEFEKITTIINCLPIHDDIQYLILNQLIKYYLIDTDLITMEFMDCRSMAKLYVRYGLDINKGMHGAAKGGHKDLVDFFIEKGANDWNSGMRGAANGGHKDLVDFFIKKGANDWNSGMYAAANGCHKDLVEFFKNKLNN